MYVYIHIHVYVYMYAYNICICMYVALFWNLTFIMKGSRFLRDKNKMCLCITLRLISNKC